MDLETTLQTTLQFLNREQKPDGSFPGYSGDIHFKNSKESSTTFSTSLILLSLSLLRHDPLAKKIIERGIAFILKEKSPEWTWNYWQRNSPESQEKPYPDDLDDTSVALAAISLYSPDSLSGSALACSTQVLFRNEQETGGPYYTWIVSKKSRTSWNDVDPAVNSNIGYFLKLNSVTLPKLIAYIETCITTSNYSSKYYFSPFPTAYFISRFYNGDKQDLLCDFIIKKQNKKGTWGNILETALAATTLLRSDCNPKRVVCAIAHLKIHASKNSWMPLPLYIEEIKKEKVFSGSRALTAALSLEALCEYESQTKKGSEEKSKKQDALEEMKITKHTIIESLCIRFEQFPQEIKKRVRVLVEKITLHDEGDQITLLSHQCIRAFNISLKRPAKVSVELGLANLHGWLAYRIYDHVLDNEGVPEDLPIANVCLREVIMLYHKLLPTKHTTVLSHILDSIEKALSWERYHCFVENKGGIISLITIPEYGDYHILAEKSYGHALGPITILIQAGYEEKSAPVQNMHSFFTHYLIARQLNDDAHDWLSDLERGFCNSASVAVLKRWQKDRTDEEKNKINLKVSERELRIIFWNETIVTITKDILFHIDKAREHLKKISILKDISYFQTLLAPLERGARTALSDRTRMLQFLEIYKGVFTGSVT